MPNGGAQVEQLAFSSSEPKAACHHRSERWQAAFLVCCALGNAAAVMGPAFPFAPAPWAGEWLPAVGVLLPIPPAVTVVRMGLRFGDDTRQFAALFAVFVIACGANEDADSSRSTVASATSGAGGGTTATSSGAGGTVVRPVRVFLMAGQSNMEGYGPRKDQDKGDWMLSGSLDELIAGGLESASLLQPRDDVWLSFFGNMETRLPGMLQPGFGKTQDFVGPELGFGQVLGDAYQVPIVLFKSAKGGTTLGADWRPPSAGGKTGPLYTEMVANFKEFLNGTIDQSFPTALKTSGYELSAFVWLQGWNDQFEDGFVAEYESNLLALVRDLRSDLASPSLPAIIVEGPTLEEPLRQARKSAVAKLNAERAGSAAYVATEDLVEEEVPGNFHFHYNAANYLEVGRRTAQAVLQLQ